jgi:hypothetical protein
MVDVPAGDEELKAFLERWSERAGETRGPLWASKDRVDQISPIVPKARLKQAALAKAKGAPSPTTTRAERRDKAVDRAEAVGVGVYTTASSTPATSLSRDPVDLPFVIVAAAVAQLVGQSEAARRRCRRCSTPCRATSPTCWKSRSRT